MRSISLTRWAVVNRKPDWVALGERTNLPSYFGL
jgi:hypothetical protein